MNLKFETIVQIFRKIIQLNAVIILKTTKEYYWKNDLKKWPQNGPLSCYGQLVVHSRNTSRSIQTYKFTILSSKIKSTVTLYIGKE